MKKEPKIVVSFTTLPNRIYLIDRVVESIMKQSVVPDKIILYISADDFQTIPEKLVQLSKKTPKFGIKLIKENYKVATKLIPALKDFPDDILINIDDDLVYKPDLIENLVNAYKKYGNKRIYSVAGHKLWFDTNGNLHKEKSYILHEYDGYDCSFMSGHGTLYPPHIFDNTNALNYQLMKRLCPTQDELWFWANGLINNIKTHIVGKYAYLHDWADDYVFFNKPLCDTNTPSVEFKYLKDLVLYIKKNNASVFDNFCTNQAEQKWLFSDNANIKVAIITAATPNLQFQYDYTNIFKVRYCKNHGYDFIFSPIFGERGKAYFKRQELLLQYLKEYDYVMWMDADAWFNDLDRSLFPIIDKMKEENKILACSRDDYTINDPKKFHESFINSGVLLFKSDEASNELIEAWKNPSDKIRQWMSYHTKLNDQPFLCIQLFFNKSFYDRVLILQPREMNYFAKIHIFNEKIFIYHGAGCQCKQNDKMMDCIRKSLLKNNIHLLSINGSQTKKEAPKRTIRKVLENDIFIPNGFDFHPTLRKATNYNKPFGLIDWN